MAVGGADLCGWSSLCHCVVTVGHHCSTGAFVTMLRLTLQILMPHLLMASDRLCMQILHFCQVSCVHAIPLHFLGGSTAMHHFLTLPYGECMCSVSLCRRLLLRLLWRQLLLAPICTAAAAAPAACSRGQVWCVCVYDMCMTNVHTHAHRL